MTLHQRRWHSSLPGIDIPSKSQANYWSGSLVVTAEIVKDTAREDDKYLTPATCCTLWFLCSVVQVEWGVLNLYILKHWSRHCHGCLWNSVKSKLELTWPPKTILEHFSTFYFSRNVETSGEVGILLFPIHENMSTCRWCICVQCNDTLRVSQCHLVVFLLRRERSTSLQLGKQHLVNDTQEGEHASAVSASVLPHERW